MRLGDFVYINPSVSLEKRKHYPCIMMAEMEPSHRYVYGIETKEYTGGGARFQNGDTLFARITPSLENGKIAQFVGQNDARGFGSTEFIVFRAREDISDPGFIFYLAKTEIVRKPAEKSMFGASGRQRADVNVIKDIDIPTPTLRTQRKIANILTAYDDLIENNTRRIKILEEMAQAIYQEWFGKLNPASLPDGWSRKKLGDIAKEVRRSVQPNQIDPETPYFGLEHFPRKSIALSEWGKVSEVQSTKLAFKQGEILFGKIRPYFHKVGVAPLDGVCSTDTIVIVPKSPEYFELVLSCVFSDEFINHSTQTSQGTKMPRANWNVLVEYPVLIPPQPLMAQFNHTIKNLVDLIENLLFSNRNLRQTVDLLLPKLISGELDVRELDIKESIKDYL